MYTCTGSGLDSVKFLHSSPYGAVLCICDQNSVDTASVLAIGEQFLLRVKAVSHSVSPGNRPGVSKSLGEDIVKTADPNRPNGVMTCSAVKTKCAVSPK